MKKKSIIATVFILIMIFTGAFAGFSFADDTEITNNANALIWVLILGISAISAVTGGMFIYRLSRKENSK